MKQRYHYNVMDSRLYQHVEKAKEDGLHISYVASLSNLWAVVMYAGTGFTSQVYESSPVFLHKEWIMEQWDKNYYITYKCIQWQCLSNNVQGLLSTPDFLQC